MPSGRAGMLVLSSVLAGLLATSCATPPKAPPATGEIFDARDVATRDDITAIYTYWREPPWLLEMGSAVGFRMVALFTPGGTAPDFKSKGCFVSGTIVVKIYKLKRDRGTNTTSRELAHEWRMNEAEAMGFRVRRMSPMGYSYMFILRWPKDLDLSGGEVEIGVEYERLDGRVIKYPPRRFRSPGVSTSP